MAGALALRKMVWEEIAGIPVPRAIKTTITIKRQVFISPPLVFGDAGIAVPSSTLTCTKGGTRSNLQNQVCLG